MIETPRAFSPPMTSKSSSFSLGEREVVGSSKMMIFASFRAPWRFQRSAARPWAGSPPGAGGDVQAEQVDVDLRALLHLFVVDRQPLRGKRSTKRFSATVRLEKRLNSWRMKAMPRGRVVWGGGRVDFPARRIVPESNP